jgi:AraC-like DNA-binding protein
MSNVRGGAEREAASELGVLGPIAILRFESMPGDPHPDFGSGLGRCGSRREPAYAFLLQAQGAASFAQLGRVALLNEGDLALCDCAAPHAHVVSKRSALVVVRAPAAVLEEHLPTPQLFCGRRLCAGDGLSESAVELTMSLGARLADGTLEGMSSEARTRVGHSLLEMLATAFAVSFDSLVGASPVMSGRQARVRRHIEERLRDPDLCPAQVAASLKLSPRYLRMIFSAHGETISAYILRRRVEECAREIADPHLRARSITEIAFSWGFNSASHFSRSFAERLGVSPRVHRRAALGREEGARG